MVMASGIGMKKLLLIGSITGATGTITGETVRTGVVGAMDV
jgi:hypothetical protein